MRILVTGSDGYIGVPLTQTLIKKGHEVVGLDTGYYRSGWLFNGVEKLPPVISKDIRNITEKDLGGFEVIVHLAELSNDPLGQMSEKVTYDINHRGTTEFAKKAKKVGISRFIYFSSCSVYGASDEILSEQSPIRPLTAYAKCKVLNENALLEMADSSFFPTILRNATVYGVSPRMRFDLAVNNLAAVAFTTGEIKMESDGTPWRPFVHVRDVCDAVVKVLDAPIELVGKQVFNVGDTKSNYQIRDVAKVISELLPSCKITLNPNGADKRNYKVNFDKIQSVLGFSCSRTLAQGIHELLDTFRKINLDKETFWSRNFTRLKQIEYLRNTDQIDEKFFWD